MTELPNLKQLPALPEDGDTYYLHWLAALEQRVVDQDLSDQEELSPKHAWARAAREASHGEPVLLKT